MLYSLVIKRAYRSDGISPVSLYGLEYFHAYAYPFALPVSMSLTTIVMSTIVLGGIFTFYQRRKSSHPHPPGPKGKLLIGNVADLPKEYPWLTFFKWGKEYGPITYLNVMGQPIVIINDHQTSVDLLEKRGAIYSDRYWSVTVMEFAGTIALFDH